MYYVVLHGTKYHCITPFNRHTRTWRWSRYSISMYNGSMPQRLCTVVSLGPHTSTRPYTSRPMRDIGTYAAHGHSKLAREEIYYAHYTLALLSTFGICAYV